jgi:Zn-dependent peptidase ImmA (M78 family)
MRSGSKPSRLAQELLQEEKIRAPIPVEEIACRHAFVVRQALPTDVSGMLVPLNQAGADRQWVIVVNEADPPARQRFTVAHELGHLLLHKYAAPHADGRIQIKFRDERSTTGSVKEEIEANQFAAELLMPERLLRMFAARLKFDVADPASDDDALQALRNIAKRLGVSVQALSYRLANLEVG